MHIPGVGWCVSMTRSPRYQTAGATRSGDPVEVHVSAAMPPAAAAGADSTASHPASDTVVKNKWR